ncbi:MAG: hypothetical protein JJU02_04525 [Cryomorphaceae bacterium]|nr:hypothetical protein [Cryomorphaceae bacterium]
MTKQKIILFAIILGLLSLIYVWFFVYNKAHLDYQSQKPAFVGESAELYEQIDGDFAEKYHDKAVEISGIIISIEGRSAILDPGVQVRVLEDTDLPEWQVGDRVTLKCRLYGAEEDLIIGGMLILCDQCVEL